MSLSLCREMLGSGVRPKLTRAATFKPSAKPVAAGRCFRVLQCAPKPGSSESSPAEVPAVPTPAQQHAPLVASLSVAACTLLLAQPSLAATASPLLDVAVTDGELAHTAESILKPLFGLFTFLYVIRIPMTWYPELDGTKLPWALSYYPTEPILSFTRKVVPRVGGVDMTPIVWVGLISFINEILLGPQGLLILLQR